MAENVVLDLGWGRLIFGQTFADPEELAEILQREGPGRRDICIYARESHVLVARSPSELFIDPSHTYRLRFTGEESVGLDGPQPVGFTGAVPGKPADADEMNRVYVRCAMVAAPVDKIWENHKNSEVVTYLVAVRDEDGTVVARSPASTTNCYSPTPRSARACGHWPSTGPPDCPASAIH